MDKLQAYQIFLKVAETKSFSRASQLVFLSQPSVSRIIQDLENELKTRLFHRKTKAPLLTEQGHQLYQKLIPLIHEMELLEADFHNKTNEISGTIRVNIPIFMPGVFYPLLGQFLLKYPKVQIHLTATNTYLDLIDHGFDLAFRIGKDRRGHQKLIYKELFLRHMVFIASPSYLEKNGIPEHPKELMKHNCLLFTPQDEPTQWEYQERNRKKSVPVSGQLHASTMIAITDMVESGLGVAYLPTYYVDAQIKQKKLCQILTKFCPPPTTFYAVFPYQTYIPRAVQALVDFIHSHGLQTYHGA